jgi:very-short-patch-repair endonuclease
MQRSSARLRQSYTPLQITDCHGQSFPTLRSVWRTFYRQEPLGEYIVDFYAPKARLVVEVDGSQHFEPAQASYDGGRSRYLSALGLQIVRFTNFEVLTDLDAVIEEIFRCVRARTNRP